MEVNDPLSFRVVPIRTDLLFKAQSALFLFVGNDGELGLDSLCVGSGLEAIGGVGCGVVVRKSRKMDFSRIGTVCEKGPHTEDEKSRHDREQDEGEELPAKDLSLGWIGLMIVIVEDRAGNEDEHPTCKEETFSQISVKDMTSQILVLHWNFRHTEHSFFVVTFIILQKNENVKRKSEADR